MNGTENPPTRLCNKCGQKDHGSAGCHTGPKGEPQISLGDEGYEKLVEGIRFALYEASLSQWRASHKTDEQTEWIKELIGLIVAAVRDGRLELSEEEWRGRLAFGPTRQMDSLVVTKGHLAVEDGDVWEVIAHRFDRLALPEEEK